MFKHDCNVIELSIEVMLVPRVTEATEYQIKNITYRTKLLLFEHTKINSKY